MPEFARLPNPAEGSALFAGLGSRAAELAVNLVVAAIILAVTVWAAGLVARGVRRGVSRIGKRHPVDSTLPVFLGSLARYAIMIIGLVVVLQQLGVQTTSIIAVLGAASLAIGLALQGALGNVAAGVMLLILRPYRVGDNVDISGHKGVVKALDLFTTELTSYEGLKVVLPNGKILGEPIINFSALGQRRFELTFGIDYGDDLDRALDILLRCADEDVRVLKDPHPWAKVTGLVDSAVNVTLRAWVRPSDYVDTAPDMIKRVKAAFQAGGLSFPYPHQVTLIRDDDPPGPVRAEGREPRLSN